MLRVKRSPREGSSREDPPTTLHGVLVTFRRPEILRDTLRALAQQTRPLDQLLVVDNDPLDENRRAVEEYRVAGLQASYLPMEENVGPAGAYAAGIATALERADGKRSWIVLVDDDDPPWSDSILEDMERFANDTRHRDPDTGAVGCGGSRFNTRTGRMQRPADEELTGTIRVDVIANGMWPFYDPNALAAAGSFDPRLFFGFEELDLGLRLGRAGYHLYCNGPLRLESRRRTGRLGLRVRPRWRKSRPAWRRYYTIRNLIWILRRNGSVGGAAWLTLTAGIGKPLVGLVTGVPRGSEHARVGIKACRDGWAGRLGRRVEPPQVRDAKVISHGSSHMHETASDRSRSCRDPIGRQIADAALRWSPLQPAFTLAAAGSTAVLAYHGIDDVETFERQLVYLSDRFQPVTLRDVVSAVDGGALPPKSVLVTLDDGDPSVFGVALPLLRKYRIPAVAFVVTGLVGTTQMLWTKEAQWLVEHGGHLPGVPMPDADAALRLLKRMDDVARIDALEELRRSATTLPPPVPHVDWTELREIDEEGLMSIEDHSLTHPQLDRCSSDKVRHEIDRSKELFERELGRRPLAFAYPDGARGEVASRILETSGYRAAFLFDHRRAHLVRVDRWAIPRLRVNSTTSPDRFATILSGLHPAIHHLRSRP